MSVPRALAYVPVEELGELAHVVVDGSSRPGTVLTLSHWPQSATPRPLARDLSAEICFAYVLGDAARPRPGRVERRALAEARRAAEAARAVTNDHFDEDGAVSLFVLTDPVAALERESLLVDVASCGDFGVARTRTAARVAAAIGAIGEEAAEADRRPGGVAVERPGSGSGPRYRAVLEALVDVVDHPDRYRRHWAGLDAELDASEAALARGDVELTEVAGLDLVVVRRLAGRPRAGGASGALPIHAITLHSASPATRVLAFEDDRCECYLRYESWVRYVSRPVARRPDLAPLAEQLTGLEPSGVAWVADGVGALVTRLAPAGDGRTDLEPDHVTEVVARYLASAPTAWDPFRPAGALVPVDERRR